MKHTLLLCLIAVATATKAQTQVNDYTPGVTPDGATEIMEVLGKEESLSRISEGIRKLTEAQ